MGEIVKNAIFSLAAPMHQSDGPVSTYCPATTTFSSYLKKEETKRTNKMMATSHCSTSLSIEASDEDK
jgi:hypothetical protein